MRQNRSGAFASAWRRFWQSGLAIFTFAVTALAQAGNQLAMTELKPAIICGGHTDIVRATAIFPNNKWLVTASDDATARLWDMETGECLHTFAGHEKAVHAVAVSHDGKWIATASDDGTARIWDVASGDQLFQFEGHGRFVRGVAFLPVGKLLTVGSEGTLRLWKIETEQQLWESEPEDSGTCLAVTADGQRAVYGGRMGVSHGWDLVTHKKLADYGENCGCNVTTVAISPDGQQVYVAVSDKSAAAYKADTGEKLPSDKSIFDPGAMGLSPDGRMIASFHHVNNALTGKRLFTLKPHGSLQETCYEFSADNRILAVGRANFVSIFRLSDPEAPIPLGPVAGSISWDSVPLKLRSLSGNEVPLEETHGYRGFYLWETASIPAGGGRQNSIDVLAMQDRVVMQSEEGLLREILYERNVKYCAVAWDGAHVWIAAADGRIFGCTSDGKVEVTLGPSQGLPATIRKLLLHPIDVDRVLVAGQNDNDGWCAVIERAGAKNGPGLEYRIRVIANRDHLPAGWNDPFPHESAQSAIPLRPLYFSEPPAAEEKPRIVMLFCSSVPRSTTPILCIDANTLRCRLTISRRSRQIPRITSVRPTVPQICWGIMRHSGWQPIGCSAGNTTVGALNSPMQEPCLTPPMPLFYGTTGFSNRGYRRTGIFTSQAPSGFGLIRALIFWRISARV
jgi:WD40 repeat protein